MRATLLLLVLGLGTVGCDQATKAAAAEHLAGEPNIALFGGETGSEIYARLVVEASTVLKPGGWLLLEHGEGQENAVQGLFSTAGFVDVTTWPDLAGIARATGGTLKSD